MKVHSRKSLGRAFAFLFVAVLSLIFISSAVAGSAKSIDYDVNEALAEFDKHVGGSKEFLKKAKGVLVFPSVIKAGFGIGGEYGEGALRINGKSKEYYNTMAASFGFQIGAQAKTIILAFMSKNALEKFRHSDGWKVGVDGSVALITLGMGDSLDTINAKEPIVAFVFGQKGLMYNLTLEGSKFNKMDKS
jgi:lipid-binding SYLF domain-containing protein